LDKEEFERAFNSGVVVFFQLAWR